MINWKFEKTYADKEDLLDLVYMLEAIKAITEKDIEKHGGYTEIEAYYRFLPSYYYVHDKLFYQKVMLSEQNTLFYKEKLKETKRNEDLILSQKILDYTKVLNDMIQYINQSNL